MKTVYADMVAPLVDAGRGLVNTLRDLEPARRRRLQEDRRVRAAGLARLDRLSRDAAGPALAGDVLVDGQWDNANFWTRYAIVRAALGLAGANETGLIGQFNRERVGEAFAALGIRRTEDFGRHWRERRGFRDAAARLLAATRAPDDILAWRLPGGFPPATVYDGILKRQRRGVVDLDDPRLVDHVAEALSAIDHAARVIEAQPVDLLVTSHAIDFAYTALVWTAAARDIPVLVLYGDYGSARFIRVDGPESVFSYPGRPGPEDRAALGEDRRLALAAAGREYLARRMGGETEDVGAIYAYQRRTGAVDRQAIAAHFGWDPAAPMVAVYASNWFDYPHFTDRMPYRDFVDWMQVTIDVAAETPGVNWLFKAHPCDEWYGDIRGMTLADMLDGRTERHVGLVDTAWNGRDILQAIDGLVTCHGTAGPEAGALGKAVLTAYPGWYGDAGFALTCQGREDYAAALARPWWQELDPATVTDQAETFAGWYFCVPDWHGGYVFPDDSRQDAIFHGLDGFLGRHAAAVTRERDMVRAWYEAGEPYYHIHKMRRAVGFVPPTGSG